MNHSGMISIWFFIGVLLLAYGILILGSGIYGLSHPPNVVHAELNAPIWWGILLIALGAIYSIKFSPRRTK